MAATCWPAPARPARAWRSRRCACWRRSAPGAFIGLWNNFHEAAAKQGNAIPEEPLYFLKNSRSIIGPGEPIRPPAGYTGKVLYEGELGMVIGRACLQCG